MPDLPAPDLLGVKAPRVAPSSTRPRHSEAEPVKRIGGRRTKADWQQEEPEMELPGLDDIETNPAETPSPETPGVNVYDEYWELLKESREMPARGETPGGSPLDVNLLSSLLHWTSVAKRRVGGAAAAGYSRVVHSVGPLPSGASGTTAAHIHLGGGNSQRTRRGSRPVRGSDVSSPRNPHRGPSGGPDPADAICQPKW